MGTEADLTRRSTLAMRRSNIGPRKAQPFPGSGKLERLLICPRCQNKGMLYYWAPYERGYETQCIKCGVRGVIHPKDMSPSEIQQQPDGFSPSPIGFNNRSKSENHVMFDATDAFDHIHEKHDIGVQRAYREGLLPRPVDHVP